MKATQHSPTLRRRRALTIIAAGAATAAVAQPLAKFLVDGTRAVRDKGDSRAERSATNSDRLFVLSI